MSTLLAVDGDSFAHRAYHALPKSIRLNAVVGFTNMLVRLWQAEEPRAVLVGWDSLDTPTYRHELFAGYQSGREFDDELLEQLGLLPDPGLLVYRSPATLVARISGFADKETVAQAAQNAAQTGT